jgi:hypothetical protein
VIGVLPVTSPVKVALVIDVGEVRTKSSADSISNVPAEAGRLALAIFPSGSPVLKSKLLAFAGAATPIKPLIQITSGAASLVAIVMMPPSYDNPPMRKVTSSL